MYEEKNTGNGGEKITHALQTISMSSHIFMWNALVIA
jgi:hypothetical protein